MLTATNTTVSLHITSGFEMLTLVDHVSEDFATVAGLDEDASHWFCVAIREAAVNAMKHGNKGDHAKRVTIEYAIVRNGAATPYVNVCVRDEGCGFNPDRVPDPLAPENAEATSGRGIFLIRSFMDDVRVQAAPGGGTEVVMHKSIGPASSPTA
jgi:serine/threonine-protein kinase RsbW